jgi:hypothetical protein
MENLRIATSNQQPATSEQRTVDSGYRAAGSTLIFQGKGVPSLNHFI